MNNNTLNSSTTTPVPTNYCIPNYSTTGTSAHTFIFCPSCGKPYVNCACYKTSSPTTPGYYTNYVSTNSLVSLRLISILDVETKANYNSDGIFMVSKDDTCGWSGTINSLSLPSSFKDLFMMLGTSSPIPLEEWIILGPIVLQFDFSVENDQHIDSRFFVMISTSKVTINCDNIDLSNVFFKEITSPIQICQLIEIKRAVLNSLTSL